LRLAACFGAPVFGLPRGDLGGSVQLAVGPALAARPVGHALAAKLVSGFNLLAGQGGLFRSQEARASLAFDPSGEAEVGAVPRLGILGASATWFAALDGTFRQGAAAHRFGLGQFGGELAKVEGRRVWSMRLILRLYT